MNKLIKAFLLVLLSATLSYAGPCDTTVGGHEQCSFDITDWYGLSEPSISSSGQGRMYFDSTANDFKCSKDGGAYETCGGSVHDEVTLAADADVLMSLFSQEIGFDNQDANKCLCGPATGAASDPTVRALVDADIPDDITITEADTLQSVTDRGATTTNVIEAPACNIPTKKITATVFTCAGANAAQDALGADGGEVYFPEADYAMTDCIITIDQANTTFTGSGWGTIFNSSGGQNVATLINTNSMSNFTIQNIALLGNPGGGDAGNLIGAGDNANYLTVRNCLLSGSDAMGIRASGNNLKIVDSTFETMDSRMVYVTSSYNSEFSGNTFNATSHYSLELLSSCTHSTISGNFFNGTGGLALTSASYSTVSDNTFKGSVTIAILSQSSNCMMNNNTIFDTSNDGKDIYLTGNYNTVVSNILAGDGGANTSAMAINIVGGDNNVIGDNISFGHDVAGIQEDAGSTGNLIDGNIVLDATPYILNGATPETFYVTGALNSNTLTASEIVITDASKNLVSAAVATYPSLAELAYVKGVTSAIQTQLTKLHTFVIHKTLETPTDADSFIIASYVPLASTITKIRCIAEAATSATIRIDECDTAGDSCAGIDGVTTIVCPVTGQDDDGDLSNAGIDVGDTLRMVVTATSGTPGHVTVTIMGTRN